MGYGAYGGGSFGLGRGAGKKNSKSDAKLSANLNFLPGGGSAVDADAVEGMSFNNSAPFSFGGNESEPPAPAFGDETRELLGDSFRVDA